jgi:hypothetical protein
MNEVVADHPDRALHVVLDQPEYSQTENGSLAESAPQHALPVHAYLCFVAEPGRVLV